MTNEALEKTLFDLKETIAQTLFTPIHKAGWPFIAGFALVSLLLAIVSDFLGGLGLILTLWCVYFFRDPFRAVPQSKSLILSPADGRVTAIKEGVHLPRELRSDDDLANEGDESSGDYTQISIFLSVFDVHVNRVPVTGKIRKVVYRPGLFLNAGNERASIENERSSALIEMEDGRTLGVVQIAGLVARRIISDLKEGEWATAGHRYGLIRFGSRLDIYLPKGVIPRIVVGQRAVGGETILADMNNQSEALSAEMI